MRLFVAIFLLAAIGLAAKIAVERLAPEGLASASDHLMRAETTGPATDLVDTVQLLGPGLRATSLDEVIGTRAGTHLSEAQLAFDRTTIFTTLLDRGHLDAAVGAATITWSRAGADVELPVDAGAVYTVHSVTWTGAKMRPAIAELPVIAAGEPVERARLADTASLVEGWLAQRHTHAHVTWSLAIDRDAKLVDVTFAVK